MQKVSQNETHRRESTQILSLRGQILPEALERKLKAKARKKFPGNKERQDAYVYGTLRKTGWTPSDHGGKKHKGSYKDAYRKTQGR